MKRVSRILPMISRTPQETAELRARSGLSAKVALFAAVAASILALYGPIFSKQFRAWTKFRPEVILPGNSWRLLATSDRARPCGDRADDPHCPASLSNQELWTSPWKRESVDLARAEVPKAARPLEYWMGVTIGQELLAPAAKAGANQLLIGWFDMPYRVWVDGLYVGGGRGWEDTEPLILRFPQARMTEGRPLHVAIHIESRPNWFNSPDILNAEGGGEGFITNDQENVFRTFFSFVWRERAFSLMVAFTVIAALFFFFWLASPLKQEYFYMALFALFSAFYQAQGVDFFRYAMSDGDFAILLASVLGYLVAACGFFLGLSFARARLVFFRWGVPLAMALPIPVLVAAATGDVGPNVVNSISDMLAMDAVPVLYALSALACFIEAFNLFSHRRSGTYLGVRTRRLALFGAGMLGLAIYYAVQSRALLLEGVRVFYLLENFEHFFFVLFFATLALREYGEQERLIARTPVSRFHQRPVLPDRVAGSLLVVDLKNSEWLFRLGAREGDSGKFVDTCVSHMWNAVIRNGGTVLQTEGDGMRAFFDEESCGAGGASGEAALKAVDDMRAELAIVEQQFRIKGLMPKDSLGLRFRGGMAVGEIKPVWQEKGGERYAAWVEAGHTNPFVESARLMELERQITEAGPKSCVVLPDELTREFKSRQWLRCGLALSAKHDVVYHVAAYSPMDALNPPSEAKIAKAV